MPRQRPAAVLVIAIFHFILATCCGAAGVFQLAGGQAALRNMQQGVDRKQADVQDRLERGIEKHFPAYKAVQMAEAGTIIALSVLLAVAGFGLLAMQPWGRWLSILYAILALLRTVVDVVIGVALVLPAVEAAARDIPGLPREAVTIGGIGGLAVGACVQIVYPIAVLIVMLLPHVGAAFRGGGPEEPRPEREEWDEDQYERRERWGEEP
jgi:hypothetical protein